MIVGFQAGLLLKQRSSAILRVDLGSGDADQSMRGIEQID